MLNCIANSRIKHQRSASSSCPGPGAGASSPAHTNVAPVKVSTVPDCRQTHMGRQISRQACKAGQPGQTDGCASRANQNKRSRLHGCFAGTLASPGSAKATARQIPSTSVVLQTQAGKPGNRIVSLSAQFLTNAGSSLAPTPYSHGPIRSATASHLISLLIQNEYLRARPRLARFTQCCTAQWWGRQHGRQSAADRQAGWPLANPHIAALVQARSVCM